MAAPALLAFDGDWPGYCDRLYAIYTTTVVKAGLLFRGVRVTCRRVPETNGKAAGFWHIIQEGKVEDERTPDLRRCERIPLIPYMISNADSDPDVVVWKNERNGEPNFLLLHVPERYLVVLADRGTYVLLKTGIYLEKDHRLQRLVAEQKAWVGP